MKSVFVASLVLAVLASSALTEANFYATFSSASGRAAEPEHIQFDSLSNSAISSMEFSNGKLAQIHRTWAPFVMVHTLGANPTSLNTLGAMQPNMTIIVDHIVNGKTVPFYTIQLSGITITKDAAGSTPTVEKLSITFQKITWTWTDGGITVTDTWGGK